MTIEINSPDLEALIRRRMQAGSFSNPEDFLREVLRSPTHTETLTARDLIAAMQSCPHPEVDIEPHREPSPLARDVAL
jgi:hypothetical protein